MGYAERLRLWDGNPPKESLDTLPLAKRGPGAGEPNPVLIAPEIRNVAE